jgi:hypothetical protein
MQDMRAVERLLGETVREIGILVVVFAPLDAAFANGPLNFNLVGLVMAWAIGAIIVGILETGE